MIKASLYAIFLAGLQLVVTGQTIPTGPAVGTRIPDFQAPDQQGRMQTAASIAGPKGSLLVFFRSADW